MRSRRSRYSSCLSSLPPSDPDMNLLGAPVMASRWLLLVRPEVRQAGRPAGDGAQGLGGGGGICTVSLALGPHPASAVFCCSRAAPGLPAGRWGPAWGQGLRCIWAGAWGPCRRKRFRKGG